MKKLFKKNSWVITDGTKGMENQSIALAKLLNTNFKLIKFTPPYLLKKIPLIGRFIPVSMIKMDLNIKPLPKFIITTGKRMAGISIFIKFFLKNKIKTIHIQNPKVSSNYFDLLLIPEHDKIIGKNIINTKGALSFIDNNTIEKSKTSITKNLKHNKKPIILFLIGGDNKRYKPNNTDYYNLTLNIVKASKSINGKLIILTSRRTPTKAIKIINSMLKKYENDFYLYSGIGHNPYPSILKLANFIIVTSDSVNMISETATFNIPLFVAYLKKEKGKIRAFLENLESLSIIKKFNGKLFDYNKAKLETNDETTLKINKFFSS